jgi:6-phosphogluconolactonase/glucosamine-6-phosphate isomerase/deaminase
LQIKILDDKKALGQAAAEHAAKSLRAVLRENGVARVVAATGASQFEFLDSLTSATDIDWNRVELFHLDEYVGLPATHPASFRKYILERIILKTGIGRRTGIGHKTGITQYHFLDGEGDPEEVAKRVGSELISRPIDIAFVGIGENGHLAFNDPPADFASEEPYRVVQLDEACRQQQVNEGWFSSTRRRSHESNLDVDPANPACERNHRRGARGPQSPGGASLPGGRNQPDGARVGSAESSECDLISRQRFRSSVESVPAICFARAVSR